MHYIPTLLKSNVKWDVTVYLLKISPSATVVKSNMAAGITHQVWWFIRCFSSDKTADCFYVLRKKSQRFALTPDDDDRSLIYVFIFAIPQTAVGIFKNSAAFLFIQRLMDSQPAEYLLNDWRLWEALSGWCDALRWDSAVEISCLFAAAFRFGTRSCHSERGGRGGSERLWFPRGSCWERERKWKSHANSQITVQANRHTVCGRTEWHRSRAVRVIFILAWTSPVLLQSPPFVRVTAGMMFRVQVTRGSLRNF